MVSKPISTPSSAAALFFAALPAAAREERVFVLPLNGNGKVLAEPILVSVGHEDGTAQIDAGTIFREALKAGAEEIIVAHNHPSGNLTPSKADIAATAKLREAAEAVFASRAGSSLRDARLSQALFLPPPLAHTRSVSRDEGASERGSRVRAFRRCREAAIRPAK